MRRRVHPVALGLALPLLAVLGLPLLRHLTLDNSIEQWVAPNADETQAYADFQARFGSDEVLIVACTAPDVWAPEVLDPLMEAVTGLEQIRGVARVGGVPVELRDRFGGEDPEAMRDAVLGSPFYRGLFVGHDDNTLGLLIQTEPESEGPTRGEVVDDVHRVLAALPPAIEVHMAGPPALNVALDRASARETARVFPIAVLASSIVLGLVLRSWRIAGAAIVVASVAVLLTMELLALFHRPLNMVTAAIPPLMWVLTLANAIRLAEEWRISGAMTSLQRVTAAVASVRRPCTIASLTTAAGFLSLAVAPLRPVQDLGLFAAAGTVAGLLLTLWTMPLALQHIAPPRRRVSHHLPTGLHRLGTRYPRPVFIIGSLVLLAGLVLLPALHVQANPLDFLAPSNETYQDYEFVRQRLTGWYTLEVMIETPDGWTHPAYGPALDALQHTMENLPGVVHVLTPTDVLRVANQWDHNLDPAAYALPASPEEARRLLAAMSDSDARGLRQLVSADDRSLRFAAIIDTMDSETFSGILREVNAALEALPAPLTGTTTGTVLQLVRAQSALVRTQVYSLAGALLVVFFCVWVGLRSMRLTVHAILPNIIPLAALALFMVAAHVPLDPATVMVASIALGIAVDDTVHVLAHVSDEQRRGWTRRSLETTIRTLERAMTATTLTTCAGFAALTFSTFQPIRWFGLLSCIALLVALAADLWVLPAQLSLWENRTRE